MLSRSLRSGVLIAALGAGSLWAVTALAAEDLDHPTVRANQPLNGGGSTVSGKIGPQVGFPAHVYTASKDGLVKITINTSNVNPNDNDKIAFRPYMRVLAESDSQAWSTNGYRSADQQSATGELIFRVKKGQKFTVIATLGVYIEKSARGNANYTLTVKE